jgi:hypothetical protein
VNLLYKISIDMGTNPQASAASGLTGIKVNQSLEKRKKKRTDG